MANKFSYGTLAKGTFFTDRKNELVRMKQFLDSENHLVLISPRRYGKSSLVKKCVEEVGRPYIWFARSPCHRRPRALRSVPRTRAIPPFLCHKTRLPSTYFIVMPVRSSSR